MIRGVLVFAAGLFVGYILGMDDVLDVKNEPEPPDITYNRTSQGE